LTYRIAPRDLHGHYPPDPLYRLGMSRVADWILSVLQEELLDQTYKAMTRKFSQSAKVWLHQLAHYQKNGDAEGARKVLERATTTAPARKHVKVELHQGVNMSISLL
jgi:hypothetical protein